MPFRVAKPCGRCVVTTIDQQTAERGRQPLAMLGRRRRFGQQLVFGQNLIPDATGTIRIGDLVRMIGAGRVHCAVTSRARNLTQQNLLCCLPFYDNRQERGF